METSCLSLLRALAQLFSVSLSEIGVNVYKELETLNKVLGRALGELQNSC